MDKIIREFIVRRGDRDIIYPFTTYSSIFSDKEEGNVKLLFDYFKKVFTMQDEMEGLKSVSEANCVIVQTEKRTSDLVKMATEANYEGMGNKQHEVVQNYLLENDQYTAAIEIPVYDNEHLGHIDIIRILGEKIQIADFKPIAHRENKAASQIARYRNLLHKQTGIALKDIEAAYFDCTNSYFLTN